jgi:hypothetical protein
MTDTGRMPPEPNWADYIDALRSFDPPTLRLARRQRALAASAASPDRPVSTDPADARQWWRPTSLENPRK